MQNTSLYVVIMQKSFYYLQLSDLCLVSDIAVCRMLCSAMRGQLLVALVNLAVMQHLAFFGCGVFHLE